MAGTLVMFPTPYTVQRIRRTKTGENALGQPIYAESTKAIPVHSCQPVNDLEKYTAALANRTIADLRIASPTNDFQPQDAVIVNGITYEVDGAIADHNVGWHGWKPGYSVNLRRVANA